MPSGSPRAITGDHEHEHSSSISTTPYKSPGVVTTGVVSQLEQTVPSAYWKDASSYKISTENSDCDSAEDTPSTKITRRANTIDHSSDTQTPEVQNALQEHLIVASVSPKTDLASFNSITSVVPHSSARRRDLNEGKECPEDPPTVHENTTFDTLPIKLSKNDMILTPNESESFAKDVEKSKVSETVSASTGDGSPMIDSFAEQDVQYEVIVSNAVATKTLAVAQQSEREVAKRQDEEEADEEEEEVVIRPRSRSKRTALTSHEEEEHAITAKKARRESPPAPSASIDQNQLKNSLSQSNDDDDEEGNTKVDQDGALLGNRTYTSKAFRLPMRGDTYYFLATEIARVSGYRDSYLLFNKNRNLKKLMTTEAEKVFLIQQDLIPYSYRNRQIGVVKALSIYKTFGARVIEKGMRVKDDYFAQRSRDLGFTEEDYANEDDRPVEDRLHAQAEAQRRADTDADIALAKSAKSTVDYNAMLNQERRNRVLLRRQHFKMITMTRTARII